MGFSKLFFRQERVGKDGVPVTVYKFETMTGERNDAFPFEKLPGQSSEIDNITVVGSILRYLGADEIPQILNLVRGEIQMIGLRIVRQCDVDHFPDDIRKYYLSRKPALISADVGIGNSNGDLELRYAYMREFIARMKELEADKSVGGKMRLELTLLRLAVRACVNKLLDTTARDIVCQKLESAGIFKHR